MTRNYKFRFIFFRTTLSYQYLANRETKLRSGDLRFHGRASLRPKGKKRKYTDCVGKKMLTEKKLTHYKCSNLYFKTKLQKNMDIEPNRTSCWKLLSCEQSNFYSGKTSIVVDT